MAKDDPVMSELAAKAFAEGMTKVVGFNFTGEQRTTAKIRAALTALGCENVEEGTLDTMALDASAMKPSVAEYYRQNKGTVDFFTHQNFHQADAPIPLVAVPKGITILNNDTMVSIQAIFKALLQEKLRSASGGIVIGGTSSPDRSKLSPSAGLPEGLQEMMDGWE